MSDKRTYRTLFETDEYTAQADALCAKHSLNVIEPILSGLLWGIATNPQAYDRTTWATRWAQSKRSLGLTVPVFTIIFQIQNEGLENEAVLLLWVEEVGSMGEILGL
jgi:hypothetical protein